MSESKSNSKSGSNSPAPASALHVLPSKYLQTKYFFHLPEGKAMSVLFGVPVIVFVTAALFCSSCVSVKTAFLVTAICVVASYFVARGGSNPHRPDLRGKTAIVTGANTGIGKETAGVLAGLGARVIIACRDVKKGESARGELEARFKRSGSNQSQSESYGPGPIEVRALDLSSTASIRKFASDFGGDTRLDLLINNAGVMMCPYTQTADGFEMQTGTNHLGHMLLCVLLLPNLKRSAARVINTSSMGHALFASVPAISWGKALSPTPSEYDPSIAYGNSKLANVLFSRELETKLAGSGAHAYTCHPGAVQTELGRHVSAMAVLSALFGRVLLKTPLQGAQTQLYLATAPNPVPVVYHTDCEPAESSPISYSDDSAHELWIESCKLLKIDA